jgi:choline kinase
LKAVILAAGVASRLKPLTDNTPKCLLKIGNKNILERTIDNLIRNDVNDIIIVTGFKQEKIVQFVKAEYPRIKVEYLYNDKYDSTNNIYSLWMTKDLVINDDMILMDSDILFDYKIIELLLNSGYQNCLAVRSDHELSDEEIKVTVDSNKVIKKISKVVDPKIAIGESIGIEKFSREYLKNLFEILDDKILNRGEVNQWYEAAFEESIDAGSKIYAVDVNGLKCMELDTIDDIESARKNMIFELDN